MGTFFSFNGRLGPNAFIKAAVILIIIGAALTAVQLVSVSIGKLLGVVGIVLIWPWLAIWVKRYHDADKSGWMCLVPIIVMFILAVIASIVIMGGSMGEIMQSADDPAAIEAMTQKFVLPQLIGNAVISLIVVFGFNAIIKSDPEENRFGPPTS